MDKLKEHALSAFEDLLSKYFYYDRKDDEELGVKDIERLITQDIVTSDDLVNILLNVMSEYKQYFKDGNE